METMRAYVERMGITAEVDYADSNPNMDSDGHEMRHWLVTLKRGDATLEIPFSQGMGLTDEPTAADVLDCLASDAASYAQAPDWLEWAKEMGYESLEDGERARETHRTIEKQSEALRDFLGGNDEVDALMFETERL